MSTRANLLVDLVLLQGHPLGLLDRCRSVVQNAQLPAALRAYASCFWTFVIFITGNGLTEEVLTLKGIAKLCNDTVDWWPLLLLRLGYSGAI